MTSADMIKALRYLRERGMTDDQLDRLHHRTSPETFAAAFDYWAKDRQLQPQSQLYLARLQYVVSRHQTRNEGVSFDQLIDDAWKSIGHHV